MVRLVAATDAPENTSNFVAVLTSLIEFHHCVSHLVVSSETHANADTTSKIIDVGGMPVAAVKWLNNRGVHLLSNFMGCLPETKAPRYGCVSRSYQEFSRPNIVREFIKLMGGIDSIDSYISLYRTKTKSFVTNFWQLYRRDSMDLDSQIPFTTQRFQSWNF